MTMSQTEFAELLKAARKERKLTMVDVAENTGMYLPIYRMIEKGTFIPDRDKLEVLCKFFDFEQVERVECVGADV